MKHTKIVEVPATTRKELDFVTCDLCKKKIKSEKFEVSEVDVKHHAGKSYPESGSGTDVSFDICGKCFDEKLVPWLYSQGAEPLTEDWDF
jgi:hypothetical protein